MKLTNKVTVIDGDDEFDIWMSDRVLKSGLLPSIPEMVGRFLSNSWTFGDCMTFYTLATKTGGRALDFYREESDVMRRPPAALALIAGTTLQAALMGLPEDDAVIDLRKIREELNHGD